jgi:hypothetical protein
MTGNLNNSGASLYMPPVKKKTSLTGTADDKNLLIHQKPQLQPAGDDWEEF